LDIPFVDSDEKIEASTNCSINDIFIKYGEQAFRDIERRMICHLLNGSFCILATGGGAFMDVNTRCLIKDRAISIWLRTDLQLLVKRITGFNHRPLLNQGNPHNILRELIDKRYKTYASADIIVDSKDYPIEVMTNKVMRALNQYVKTL
ncbi:MAG: hypothetical protein LBS66_01950, partial [Rhodospirillaceae bacterium]|nr:hypothetical protein [Rhodospirillaceae bacterium]